MPTLYEFPPTRSQRAKWALEELGVDYDSDMVNLREGQQHGDNYRKVNPLGVVPSFACDGYTMTESAAIVMQLIDEHPESRLAPEIGTPQRAAYYQWCTFGPAELDGPLGVVTQNEMLLPEDKRDGEAAKRGRDAFSTRGAVLSGALENTDYLVDNTFSGADIVIGYNCFWATFTGLLNDFPVLQAYLGRLQERAAFQRSFPPPPE